MALETFQNSSVMLGGLPVTRALPVRGKRMVGPWCFIDRFGPMTFAEGKPMDVAPHPHIGLQTVTWLLSGEVLHDDSLGCEATARPGGVNVMTAGQGIAHAEQTPLGNSGVLNGVQLWVALPDAVRNEEAGFQAVSEVPVLEERGGIVQVFAGGLCGVISPSKHFSSILGADVRVHAGEALEFGLHFEYEHAVLMLDGDCALDGEQLVKGLLYYMAPKRASATFTSRNGGRALLIGGEPFSEQILMWWNFVARTPEEIAAARADWEAGVRFGEVKAYNGPRLAAPSLTRVSRPNPMS